MVGSSTEHGPDQADIDRLFMDPAFRELGERGGPALVASVPGKAVAWANAAARRFFGEKLETIAARLSPGEVAATSSPRIKRLFVEDGDGGVKPVTFLTKATSLADGQQVFVIAMLGAAPVEAEAPEAPVVPAAEPELADALPERVAEPSPASAEAPAAAPVYASAGDVRARLLRTHPSPTVRFLWQTDAEDRVTSVTPPLGEVVGASHADLAGRDLTATVTALKLDESGGLLAAIRARATWSGIEVNWPIEDAAAAVPIDLGAFPVFDADRAFRGFRGFGTIHLDRIRAAEPLPRIAVEAASEETPVASTAPPEPSSEALSKAPAGEGTTASEPAAPAHHAPVPGANVVPLRPYGALGQAFGRGAAHSEPATSPSAEASAPAPEPHERAPDQTLSPSEHLAFDEIARALSEDTEPATKHDAARDLFGHETSGKETSGQDPLAPASDPLHAVLDRLPLAILITRAATPLYANRALLDLAGFSSLDDLHAAGGLGSLFDGEGLADHSASTRTIRARHGETVAVEAKLQTLAWEGQPASLITLRRASDGAHFAQAKTLELELQHRDSETRELRAILDTATDGVAILDANGRILSLNRSAEALFGYEQNEVAGESFTMLVDPESRQLVDDYLARLKSGGVASLLNDGREVIGLARHGGKSPIFLNLGRIGIDERQPKFCAVIRDLTSWKRAEQEAREAREEAERASAIKSDFLAKVSHEIRTPLNAIIGFAEVIMDERLGPVGTERYKDYLRDIHRSGTHVMSLVNDLLDLSKIEAGKMVLDIKRVDANAIISECVALMQPQANRERVIMRLALAPRLMNIAADERSLRQIVLNLLSNAVKYNEPGGQVIVSTAMTDTGNAVIRIKDTGIGMSEAELEVALEPFSQVATARSVSGTGLGLPLTKALVEANRASFTIRSRKNEGTLVEVNFPPTRVLAETA